MALSQIQCLDNNNVNWRSSETKPEFFYSEEQRLALEALVSSGPDAFYEVIKKEKIRDFLSELEVGKVLGSLEPFDPDSGHSRSGCDKCALGGDGDKDDECGGGSGGGAEQSLEYWPDKSDCVIPELDLGWPGTVAYRGVTRATVYMQPPIDGQPHIKEVIRKMITQAQKVIAVVMDLFTDVDILKDMLDAGFKRKVSVYIILNESDVKYFLQMCERAQMHKGHLKNLRIRSIGGSEFYTRFSTKFKGCLSQKFMFVDGDKAACGSYSFTWSAARIDRNLLTVLSGQVVESFDHQFQELYLLSKAVSLKNVPMENEPEPEPMIQPAPLPAGPPQSIAKKLINPKYALVSVKSASEREVKQAKVKLLEQKAEEPQIHPALLNMERANMFNYLPTWVEPEPEPGSDILGYINIIDPKVKNPMHSQMNRIKICDTANATAQFLMQTKKQEGGGSACEDTSLQVNKARHAENEEPGHCERTTARQGSREEGSATSSTKVVSPSSSFDEDLETPSLKDHKAVGQPGGHNVQQSREGFASPAETHSLGSGDQGQAPVTRSGPPVPKPRTLPVTDFISMKNALNAKSVTANTSKVENTIPSVNGGDAEGREEEDIEDLLIQTVPGGNDEGDTDRFGMYPNECLSSGSGSLPPSNASSTSEEYYPTKPLQRRSSDRIPNGEHIALQRKLSDGHISRGTFAGPLGGISQSLMDMRQVENGKRRNQTLEEELKRVLSKGEPNKDRTHAMEPTKGKGLFRYSSTGPSTGLERFQTQRPSRTATKGRGKKDVPEGPGLFRQANRKSEGHGGRPGYWSTKDLAGTYPSSLSQSLVTPDTPTTPFGIPYSKLSQAKHLKNKLGTTMDPRRRSHGPPGHKDV